MTEKIALVQEVLGQGIVTGKGNHQFHCPFCNLSPKEKLSVHEQTEKWRCWVCPAKGRSLYSLLKRAGASTEKIERLKKVSQFVPSLSVKLDTLTTLQLPQQFKPLYVPDKHNFYWNKAISYLLNSRGVAPSDLVKYNIGYCDDGPWKGFIIFPNYDDDGQLNYFTTRSYLPGQPSFKNPTESRREIVGYELQVNWQQPVVVVEGALDAITTGSNASPLYGKLITQGLKYKILECGTPKVFIALDGDALKDSISALRYFLGVGIEVALVKIPFGLDPNKLGKIKMQQLISSSKLIQEQQLLELQIKNSLC